MCVAVLAAVVAVTAYLAGLIVLEFFAVLLAIIAGTLVVARSL
jgi:hypothetical protein